MLSVSLPRRINQGIEILRIVHFSDIHATSWISGFRGYFDKRILGTFNFLLRRKAAHNWNLVHLAVPLIKQLSPDIVICTGDLATLSGREEFELAKKTLSPLVEDSEFEFIYVPGNHDYYINTTTCRKLLEQTFYFMNRNGLRLNDLPTSRDIEQARFLLLNEARPSPFYASSGAIDTKTQNWLHLELAGKKSSGQEFFLIGHYPLFDANGRNLSWRRRCWNNSVLQTALRDGTIGVSLCGHIHDSFARWEKNGSVEICAGSLTKTGKLNVVDCNSRGNDISQKWVDVRTS